MNALEPSGIEAKAALETELKCLLGTYLAEHRSLNSWDCHCLGAAIAYLKLGFYSQALEWVMQILPPPVPVPTFPFPQPLTLEDVRNAIRLVSTPN
jgi:hypothetical protein